MHSTTRPLQRTSHGLLITPLLLSLVATFGWQTTGVTQEYDAPLRISGLAPGGVRSSVSECWGALELNVTNLSEQDRQARALVYYDGFPDMQYGRDIWVPARSSISSWLPVGPAPSGKMSTGREIQMLLYDRTNGREQLILPPGEERRRNRALFYRKRDPSTAIYLDELGPEEEVFGRLPQPDSPQQEAIYFAHTLRQARSFSPIVQSIYSRTLPPVAEAYDGIDHLILASSRLGSDAAGTRALRQWLQQGGTLWIMLDLVEPEVVSLLLGDAVDFQVVDRVSLTEFTLQAQPILATTRTPPADRQDQPVEFVRVLLPQADQAQFTIDDWPACFVRKAGRGNVIFTTLGARGWLRPRRANDPPSRDEAFPLLPMPTEPLQALSGYLRSQFEEKPFRVDAFGPMLTQEIGYSVMSVTRVAWVFGGLLIVELLLGIAIRKSRRPELVGWLVPGAALGAAMIFFALGESSRQAAAATIASGQLVEPVSGTGDVAVQGLLAVYNPESGLVRAGASGGGTFELDVSGLEGQARRRVQTDLDAWSWEGLSLPAGVRQAPFRFIARDGKPITASARLGQSGLSVAITQPKGELSDAILTGPGDRKMALRREADGSFSSGSEDILPQGQLVASATLSDRQQRRLALYRELLQGPASARLHGRFTVLAWSDALELPFDIARQARQVGDALIISSLQIERPELGTRISIPGPLVPYQRIISDYLAAPLRESTMPAEMRLRFQLPREVLPFQVDRATLLAKIHAPGRKVMIAGAMEGKPITLYQGESPLDPIRIEIEQRQCLTLDADGGLHIGLSLSRPAGLDSGSSSQVIDPKWEIEYLELEVAGTHAEKAQ